MSSELERMAREAEEIGKALEKRAKKFPRVKFAIWESVRNLSNIVAQLDGKAKKIGEELEERGGDFATWESVRNLSNIVAALDGEAKKVGEELEERAKDFATWESVRDLSNIVAALCRKLDNPGAETA